MNFLSHYYLDAEDDRPYYVFGIIIPDLLKNFNRRWKVKKNPQEYEQIELQQIEEGIARHIDVDAHFHNSDFFKENTLFISDTLKKNEIDSMAKHTYFLAHVILELMIDRLLVKNYPNICEQFYAILNRVEKSNIDLYLNYSNFVQEMNDFSSFFEKFKTSKYIFHYANNENLIFALNKIIERATGNPLSKEDGSKLNTSFV